MSGTKGGPTKSRGKASEPSRSRQRAPTPRRKTESAEVGKFGLWDFDVDRFVRVTGANRGFVEGIARAMKEVQERALDSHAVAPRAVAALRVAERALGDALSAIGHSTTNPAIDRKFLRRTAAALLILQGETTGAVVDAALGVGARWGTRLIGC